MIAAIQTYFETSADTAWKTLKKKNTFLFITRGVLGFVGAKNWPEEFTEGLNIHTRFVFFHLFPAWKHHLRIVKVDEMNKILYSNEKGGLIRIWNHLIQITPQSEKRCRYADRVEIDAGIFTPLVWAYAHLFYRYRHYRWKKLLRGL